LHFSLYGAGRR